MKFELKRAKDNLKLAEINKSISDYQHIVATASGFRKKSKTKKAKKAIAKLNLERDALTRQMQLENAQLEKMRLEKLERAKQKELAEKKAREHARRKQEAAEKRRVREAEKKLKREKAEAEAAEKKRMEAERWASLTPEQQQAEIEQKAKKKKTVLIIIIAGIVGLVLCLACGVISNIMGSSDSNTASDSTKTPTFSPTPYSTKTPTLSPTPEPTLYALSLPQSVETESGHIFEITSIEVLTNISDDKPDNGLFLVFLGRLTKTTDSSGCTTADEFALTGGFDDSMLFSINTRDLSIAKKRYNFDYPGGVLGQCPDEEGEDSFLIFDIPSDVRNLWLRTAKSDVPVGDVQFIESSGGIAITPTLIPTPTPTSTPDGVKFSVTSELELYTQPNSSAESAEKVAEGEIVWILAVSQDQLWAKIVTSSNKEGWLLLSGLTEDETIVATIQTVTPLPTATPTPSPTNTPTLTPTPDGVNFSITSELELYAQPNSSAESAEKVVEGEIVWILAVSQDQLWAKIVASSNKEGWLLLSGLTEDEAIVATIPTVTNTPTATPLPTITPTPSNTPTPTPSNTPTATPDLEKTATIEAYGVLIAPKGNGFYTVGKEILPGKWHSTGTGDGCYWARLDANQKTLGNHFGSAGGTVNIKPTDYEVEFNGCGTWKYVENENPVLQKDATEPKGNGFYTVGNEIAPGKWESTGTGDGCYWARLDGSQNTLDNHFGNAGGSITIRPTDYEVEFNGCGTWEYVGP